MLPAVNDLLVEEAIRHQVTLAKYSNHVIRQMIAVLNRSDQRLFQQLMIVLDQVVPSQFQVTRLEALLGSIRSMNADAYGQLDQEVRKALLDFVVYETGYQEHMLESFTPVEVHVARVVPEQVYAAAMARPFQGLLLNQALKDAEVQRAKRIRTTIAQGYTENKTTDQIVRELRGTKAAQYQDGLLEVDRRSASAIVRTALAHTASVAQGEVAKANADIIEKVMWSATLDLRTSEVCRIRDGRMYTMDHRPIGHDLPWLGGPGNAHWNCRSGQVWMMKGFAELGLDLPEVTTRGGTRASMDGQVPKDLNYADWLAKQSAARQDEVLGPTRGKLLRSGNLPLERMYGLRGQFLTLDQLRAQDATAFARAGL